MRRHSSRRDPREAKTKRNEWRITKMVLVIFISFLVCYLPITIVKVTDTCVNHPGKEKDATNLEFGILMTIISVMHLVGYVLIYLSACLNPIIYVFMNKQYRQAFSAVLCPSSLLPITSRVTFHSSKARDENFPRLTSNFDASSDF